MRAFPRECVLAPLFKLFEATLELLVPFVMAAIIDVGIKTNDKEYILWMSLLLVLFASLGYTAAVVAQYFSARAGVGISTRIRHDLMAKIHTLSYEKLDTIGISTVITRMTSDTNQVQTGVNLTLRLLLRSPFVVFGAMIMAYIIDVRSALVFTGVIVILSIVVFGIIFITVPMHKKSQKKLDSVTVSTRENLTGVRVIRAFVGEGDEECSFRENTKALEKSQRAVGRITGLLNPLTVLIVNLAVVLLLFVGAIRVNVGAISQGEVVALYNFMALILTELVKFANLIITITKSVASAHRIEAVLSAPSEHINYKVRSLDKITRPLSIRFENVSLKYNGAGDYSLKNITFKLDGGKTLGIIGGTGSGKTSLVNLIPRFYPASTGRVFVGGIDVCELSLEELRKSIGVVPQNAVLFRGSVRSNLLWGNPDASDKELLCALKSAAALDIIEGKDGLDTEIMEGGVNLSGGQRQRLSIARALVKKPKILILDDSASALDYATESLLKDEIASLDFTSTRVIVSQRASSVMSADLILVLDDASLVGAGTHEELLKTCEVYREIYNSQFTSSDADGKEDK